MAKSTGSGPPARLTDPSVGVTRIPQNLSRFFCLVQPRRSLIPMQFRTVFIAAAATLGLMTAAAPAQADNFGGSLQQQPLSAASSPLVLVRGGGGGGGRGGGFGGGGHGFAGGHSMSFGGSGPRFSSGHMRSSRDARSFAFRDNRRHRRGRVFVGSGDYGYYGYDYGCWYSRRYHRWVCPNYY